MKKLFVVLCLVGGLLVLSSCAPLTKTEQAKYNELQKEGVFSQPIEHKNVWAAGFLDLIVPGFGHYYLGQGVSGTGLLLSNIFWPLSPLWATPAGIADTDNANKRYTLEYYTFGPGKKQVAKLMGQKCFEKAKKYIELEKQKGQKTFSQTEISQVLFLANFTPQEVTSIDWSRLQRVTGCTISPVARQAVTKQTAPPPRKG